MQPALIRFLRWLESLSTVRVLLGISVIATLAFLYADVLKDFGLGVNASGSDCLTRDEMTNFIRRHHAADHSRTSGLRSLSAQLGLLPPGIDIEVDWDSRPRTDEQADLR